MHHTKAKLESYSAHLHLPFLNVPLICNDLQPDQIQLLFSIKPDDNATEITAFQLVHNIVQRK